MSVITHQFNTENSRFLRNDKPAQNYCTTTCKLPILVKKPPNKNGTGSGVVCCVGGDGSKKIGEFDPPKAGQNLLLDLFHYGREEDKILKKVDDSETLVNEVIQ